MLPHQSKGLTATPAPPGMHNKPASLRPEVGAECIYSTSSALRETELGNTLLNTCSLTIFIQSWQRCPGKALLQHTAGKPASPGSPNLQSPLQPPRSTAVHRGKALGTLQQPHKALSCRMESRDTAGTEQADLARDALVSTTNLR